MTMRSTIAAFVVAALSIVSTRGNENSGAFEGVTVYSLPDFTIKMMVRGGVDGLDLDAFQQQLDAATVAHLELFFQEALLTDLLGTGLTDHVELEEIRISSIVVPSTQDSPSSATTGNLEADFEGVAIFNTNSGAIHRLNSAGVQNLVATALSGDHYWRLWHRFVSDPTLQGIEELEIDVNAPLIQVPREGGSGNNSQKPGTTLIILAVFSGIMIFFTFGLAIFTYRKFRRSSDGEFCCGSSKDSEGTIEEDDSEEDDVVEPQVKQPTSRRQSGHRKKRKPPQRLSVPKTPILVSIEECDEEGSHGSSVDKRSQEGVEAVPLGNWMGSSISAGVFVVSSPTPSPSHSNKAVAPAPELSGYHHGIHLEL